MKDTGGGDRMTSLDRRLKDGNQQKLGKKKKSGVYDDRWMDEEEIKMGQKDEGYVCWRSLWLHWEIGIVSIWCGGEVKGLQFVARFRCCVTWP